MQHLSGCPNIIAIGLLNPLDAPHHVRQDEWSEYREGIVLDRPVKSGKGSYANVGMRKVSLPILAEYLCTIILFIGSSN